MKFDEQLKLTHLLAPQQALVAVVRVATVAVGAEAHVTSAVVLIAGAVAKLQTGAAA